MRARHARVSRALRFALAIVVGAAVGAPFTAWSQAKGAIGGSVADPVGAIAAKVTVVAKDAAGKAAGQATSDAKGKYTIGDLPAGSYDVSVAVPGLKNFEKKAVMVNAGATAALTIRLEEGTQLSTLGEDPLGIAADRARHKPPTGPTPRSVDGKPDLSGVWWQPVVTDPGKPEWLPAAQDVAAKRQARNRIDSPQTHCLPAAVLRRGPLVEFVQSRDKIIEITDDDSPGFHHIYLARSHPKEPDMLWHGDSVGRWDGDTLIVDKVNFLEDVWLDADGHPHSDKLHVVERYRRPDLGHLEIEVTVEDSGVLAKAYTFKRTAELAPTEEIREFICNENNTDVEHFVEK